MALLSVKRCLLQLSCSSRDFSRAMAVRLARGGAPRYEWGPKLPRSEWPRVEAAWMRNIVRPRALKKIRADHSLYARDYDRFT